MSNEQPDPNQNNKEKEVKIPPRPTIPSAGSNANPEQSSKPEATPKQVGVTVQQLQGKTAIVNQPIIRKSSDGQDAGGDTVDRRTFVKWLTVGWVAFAAVLGGYGTLVLRFFFPNVLFEPKQSFRAGHPDDYVVGEVSERYKETQAVWIVRDAEKIYALSTVCTHLGCTPNWLSNEAKFKCPCHGSGFYKTGVNFEGPAPRPLERFRISLADDGELIVDKTRIFQQEKGEWNDPESFIQV